MTYVLALLSLLVIIPPIGSVNMVQKTLISSKGDSGSDIFEVTVSDYKSY